jgi:hypothetical protein
MMRVRKKRKHHLRGKSEVVDVARSLSGVMRDVLLAMGQPGLDGPPITVTVLLAIYQRFVALRGHRDTIYTATIPDLPVIRRAFWLDIQRLVDAEHAEELMGVALAAMTGLDDKRKCGVHFTPRYLARQVVSKTLAPLFRVISPGSELKLRICDPACGGGVFLSEVACQIAHRLPGGKTPHNLRMAAMHCAYGVDCDPCAVTCTKLALRLQCQAFRMPRAWLDANVHYGDALVGVDNDQIKAFSWDRSKLSDKHPLISRAIDQCMDRGVARRNLELSHLRDLSLGVSQPISVTA